MVNRRELLQAGAALGTFPLIALSDRAHSTESVAATTAASPLYKLIFDSRFAAGRTFAREAAGRADPHWAHGIEGDITDVWYRDLHTRWRQSPHAIGGLTAYGAVFCLERLAWDAGMRVVFRIDHNPLADGSYEHVVHGSPQIATAAAKSLRNAGPSWSAQAARLIADTRLSMHGTYRAPPLGPSPKSASAAAPVLMSWVIAPV